MSEIILKEIKLEEAVKFMCDGNVYFKSDKIENLNESNLRKSILDETTYYIEHSEDEKDVYVDYYGSVEEFLGSLGEYTGYKDYHVGDIVTYSLSTGNSHVDNKVRYGMIVNLEGDYTSYGWGHTSLSKLEVENKLKIFKKYYDVTSEDIANYELKTYIK